jgi:hypothetical protein
LEYGLEEKAELLTELDTAELDKTELETLELTAEDDTWELGMDDETTEELAIGDDDSDDVTALKETEEENTEELAAAVELMELDLAAELENELDTSAVLDGAEPPVEDDEASG